MTSASTPASTPAAARPAPQPRDAYAVFRPITTRWADNDVYGHVNNVVYYSWFDTAVNAWLIEQGALDIHSGEVIGQAGVARWMLEIIAYFDQLGFLIITPLVPVLMWLALDRAFVKKLWVEMVLAGAAEAARLATERGRGSVRVIVAACGVVAILVGASERIGCMRSGSLGLAL